MSGRRSRDKGARTERAIVRVLQGQGIAATEINGMYKPGADINVSLLGIDLAGEVKCRAAGFSQLYDWLNQHDVLIADRREPLVVARLSPAALRAKCPAYVPEDRWRRAIADATAVMPADATAVMPADATAVMPADATAVMPADATAVMPAGDMAQAKHDATPYASALAALRAKCPAYVPEDRWRQVMADATAFTSEWGERAQAFAWTERELFGLHPTAPMSRFDEMGAVWLARGRPIVELTSTAAVYRCANGARLTYRRRIVPVVSVETVTETSPVGIAKRATA